MRTPTESERVLIESLREIRECEELIVDHSGAGQLTDTFEEAPAIFEYLPDWTGVQLSHDLCVNSPRISQIGSRWRIETSQPELHGEFRITDLFTALLKHPPDLTWQGSTCEERDFFASLRVIDDTPIAATGQLAAIRVQPHVDPLEIWYYDMDLNEADGWDKQYVRMDITYPEYIYNLAATKGTFGWQYLFTGELSLRGPYLENIGTHLTAMLEIFPRLFPAWDYTSLANRLEARR
ncbi:hypothetical protein [Streptomyces noursei]|uniref:hypothetical protein n=1 Tax=Streptomyces noursei TaxID=1971 RepID=UPI0023B7DF7D|nr:hypothetical protein [Streptomyces noursei]